MGTLNAKQRKPAIEAKNVINMAFQMIAAIDEAKAKEFSDIDMRIGIHTGDIIGGVIGTDIVRYDIYGPHVLIANKMESNGERGRVMVSESTYKLVNDSYPNSFSFEKRAEEVCIKSLGDLRVQAYFVADRQPDNVWDVLQESQEVSNVENSQEDAEYDIDEYYDDEEVDEAGEEDEVEEVDEGEEDNSESVLPPANLRRTSSINHFTMQEGEQLPQLHSSTKKYGDEMPMLRLLKPKSLSFFKESDHQGQPSTSSLMKFDPSSSMSSDQMLQQSRQNLSEQKSTSKTLFPARSMYELEPILSERPKSNSDSSSNESFQVRVTKHQPEDEEEEEEEEASARSTTSKKINVIINPKSIHILSPANKEEEDYKSNNQASDQNKRLS